MAEWAVILAFRYIYIKYTCIKLILVLYYTTYICLQTRKVIEMSIQTTQRMSQLSKFDASGIEQLLPGHMKALSISDQAGNELVNINYVKDKDTADKIDGLFRTAKQSNVTGAGGLEAAFVVVRTDNWKDFAEDLFLPMFVNHILKIDNVALRILTAIPAIAFDILTLAPRIAISPFRAIYNHFLPSKVNELSKIIVENVPLEKRNLALAAIQKGLITVKLREESVDFEDAENSLRANQKVSLHSFLIAVKKLPGNLYLESSGNANNIYRRSSSEKNRWITLTGGIGDPKTMNSTSSKFSF
ncbi:MAG: hypothetical protein H0U49_03625 [Parachlamydiaceae bacterium]|nr:hypothetical protein [Parachlamydiaceae bacterium]